jgi:hypothetical protein
LFRFGKNYKKPEVRAVTNEATELNKGHYYQVSLNVIDMDHQNTSAWITGVYLGENTLHGAKVAAPITDSSI